MAEEEFEEEETEEEAPRARGRVGRGGGGRGGGSFLSSTLSWASRHRVPLMVGGGFLLAYWVGHRRGKRIAQQGQQQPVTQIYLPPQSTAGFRTGIQSSSPMWDARFYDPPSGIDAY